MPSQIGFSAIKITPLHSNIPLGGYYVRYSEGVHDDIFVRTIYLAANEEIFIIACDLLGLYGHIINRLRKRITQRTGVKEKNILICSLHNHSAPDTIGLEGIKGYLKDTLRVDWFQKIEEKIINSAVLAKKNANYGKIGVKTKFLDMTEKLIINRRHPRQPINYPLFVFGISNETALKASIIHYACHGTTLNRDNRLISAEYPGYLIRKVEKNFAPHFSMYLNGPCGDINPYLFPTQWDFNKINFDYYFKGDFGNYNALCSYEHTQRIGERLADHAISLLQHISTNEITNINVYTRKIEIPIEFNAPHMKFMDKLSTLLIKQGILRLLRAYNRSNVSYFSFIEKNKKMYVQTEIQLIKINNNILIVAIPAEVFHEIGEELLAQSPIKNTIIVCLANDWIGYVFPLKECKYGGYEVFGVPNLAGILAGTIIKNTILSMYKQLSD